MSASRTMSEADSKTMVAGFGVRLAREELATDAASAVTAASSIGFPVVAKLCGEHVAHKTERGLVRLGLADAAAVEAATNELLGLARPEDEATGVLIAEQVSGSRELIAGVATDPQFGATVMVGIGGVLAEAIADVSIRMVPVTRIDAEDMIDDLAMQTLLVEFRGEPPVDRSALVDVIVALSAAAESNRDIRSIDLNPLIVVNGQPIAVDALVELDVAELTR